MASIVRIWRVSRDAFGKNINQLTRQFYIQKQTVKTFAVVYASFALVSIFPYVGFERILYFCR